MSDTAKASTSETIEIKTTAEIAVFSCNWQGHYQETGEVLGKLYKAAGRFAVSPAMNLYHDQEYKIVDAQIETCVPVKDPVSEKAIAKLPENCEHKKLAASRVYAMIHHGPYDTLALTYAKLFERINDDGKTATTPSREIYHKGPGMFFKGNPNNYQTEIQIPVID